MSAIDQKPNAAAGAEDTSAREIATTRLFDAPRELVFDAFTDAKKLARWWGPNGFTITTHEFESRPGGVWRFTMHGPDGTDYPNKIVWAAIDRPERIVYDHVSGPPFHTTITFVARGSKTEVTMRAVFESAALRDRVVKEFGAIEGMQQTMGRLGDLLADRAVTLQRELDAPRVMVYQAWTDPRQVVRWWGPNNFTTPLCEMDVRANGAIRIDMRGPDGATYTNRGAFHEVAENERLVFNLETFDAQGNSAADAVITVTFAEHDGRTRVTVIARVVSLTVPGFADGMEEGWSETLDRLVALLK
jgi:uncharacterized protein YndB with AHSA1/START domain